MSAPFTKDVAEPTGPWVYTAPSSAAHTVEARAGYAASVPASVARTANTGLSGLTVKVQVRAARIGPVPAGARRDEHPGAQAEPFGRFDDGLDDGPAAVPTAGSGASTAGTVNHLGDDAYSVAILRLTARSGNSTATHRQRPGTRGALLGDIVDQVIAVIAHPGPSADGDGAEGGTVSEGPAEPGGVGPWATARPSVANGDEGRGAYSLGTLSSGTRSGNAGTLAPGARVGRPRDDGVDLRLGAAGPVGAVPGQRVEGGPAAWQPDGYDWAASASGHRRASPVAQTTLRPAPSGLAAIGLLLLSACAYVVGTMMLLVGAISRPYTRKS